MPATEQLNIRVPPAVKDKFRERARREGMSQAELLEALLKQRGTLPALSSEPSPAVNGDRDGSTPPPPERTPPGSAPPSSPPIDFPRWLASRRGTARALAARAVRAGRVTIAGVPYTSEEITKETLELGEIVYEGRPL